MGNRESAIEDTGLYKPHTGFDRLCKSEQGFCRSWQGFCRLVQARKGFCKSRQGIRSVESIDLYRIDRGSAEAVQSPRQASGHE